MLELADTTFRLDFSRFFCQNYRVKKSEGQMSEVNANTRPDQLNGYITLIHYLERRRASLNHSRFEPALSYGALPSVSVHGAQI